MTDDEQIMSRDEISWRNYIAERLRANEERVADLARQHQLFQAEMVKNTEATEAVKKDTGAMLEVFNSWRGAMAALEFLAKVAKWVTAIGSAGVVIYVFLRTGDLPSGK